MSRRGDAVERSRARMALRTGHFPDVCSFSTVSTSKHSYGYTTDSDTGTLPSIPCELQPLAAYETLIGGQSLAGANGRLKTPANGDTLAINANFTGTIAARGTSPAITFRVVGPLRSSTNNYLYLAVTVG